jgi:hypothetical protein
VEPARSRHPTQDSVQLNVVHNQDPVISAKLRDLGTEQMAVARAKLLLVYQPGFCSAAAG